MPKAHKEPADTSVRICIGLDSGHWQYPTAEAHFIELFERALEAPQLVRRNDEGVILMPSESFCRLVALSYAPADLVELLSESELDGIHYGIGFGSTSDNALKAAAAQKQTRTEG